MKAVAPSAVQNIASAMGVTDRPLARRLLCHDDLRANIAKIWATLIENGHAKTTRREPPGFDGLPADLRPFHVELDLSPSKILDEIMIKLMQLRTWDVSDRVKRVGPDLNGSDEISPNERACAALFVYVITTFALSRRDLLAATRAEADAFIERVYPADKRTAAAALCRTAAGFEGGELKDALLLVARHFDAPWQAERLLASPYVVDRSHKRRPYEERVKATLIANAVREIFGDQFLEATCELTNVVVEPKKPFTPQDIRNWAPPINISPKLAEM